MDCRQLRLTRGQQGEGGGGGGRQGLATSWPKNSHKVTEPQKVVTLLAAIVAKTRVVVGLKITASMMGSYLGSRPHRRELVSIGKRPE